MSLGRSVNRAGLLFVAICACVAIGLGLALRAGRLALNASPSMRVGVYRIVPADRVIRRGDVVVACAPSAAARVAALRAYVPEGGCPFDTAPLLKFVAAVAGDRIDTSASRVCVDGMPLPASGVYAQDSHNRSLQGYRASNLRIADGYLWLYAPVGRSWDSRYFGPVATRSVRGFASLLIPFSGESQRRFDQPTPRDRQRRRSGRIVKNRPARVTRTAARACSRRRRGSTGSTASKRRRGSLSA